MNDEILPPSVGIKLFKSTPAPVRLPANPNTSQPSAIQTSNLPSFELNLARASLLVDVTCLTLIGLAPNSIAFIAFTLIGSWAQGFTPSVQSVALELYSRRGEKENGKLFGGLSVIQALRSV
jgi:hypothetical protein